MAIINQKGGVGKTTSTINVGGALAFTGSKVVLLDLDTQCDLSSGLGVETADTIDVISFVHRDHPMNLKERESRLFIIRGNAQKAVGDLSISEFQTSLQLLSSHFDYAFLDCPPQWVAKNNTNHLALSVSDHFIVPLDANYYSVKNANSFIEIAQSYPSQLMGFLFCNVLQTRKLSQSMMHLLHQEIPEKVFTSFIRADATIEKSVHQQQTLFQYNPNSRAAQDYLSVAQELQKR